MTAITYLGKQNKKVCPHKKFGGLGANGEFVKKGYWQGSTYYKRTGTVYEGKPEPIKIDQDIINRMVRYAEELREIIKGKHPSTRFEIESEIERVEKFINQYI